MPKDCKRMCKGCPFRRDIQPGYLGGSSPEVYIGQIGGPFRLNCHSAAGYRPDATPKEQLELPQCAGAAIFRANLGLEEVLGNAKGGDGSSLHFLPSDVHAVFASMAEFLSHHGKVPKHIAERMLHVVPPEILTRFQMMRADTKQLA